METVHPTLIFALALAAGVLAQSVARHLRLPGIVLLLAAGIGLGPDGLGWVQPDELGGGLYALVDLAVAVILFEGGLNLEISRLRREQAAIRRLVTWGAGITLLGGTLAARMLMGWGWDLSFLFGSLVVVTGPTVVGPLVAELRLRPRVATVLEAEGVLIDPIGAILAVLVLEITIAPGLDTVAAGGLGLVLRLAFGAGAGVVAGFLLARLLAVRRLVPEGHQNILVLATVLLLFEACNAWVAQSGIMAVTIAGVVVGNLRTPVDRDLREFKDQMSVLLIGLLFIMLAAGVRFEEVWALGGGGLLVVASLVLCVRPLQVFLATRGSELSLRERSFIAWVAPRGIVAAAIASIVGRSLESAGVAGGVELRALVFLTIACTVVVAGLSAGPVGRWLGVRLPGRDGVAILGAGALGIALGKALRDGGRAVTFLDSNPHKSRVVEELGFPVVFGNAIQERTLQRAGFEAVETAVALTGNKTLNGVFVNRAQEIFGVPRGLVAATEVDGGLVSELVEREAADVIFEGHHDIDRWDPRWRRGDVDVIRCGYLPPPDENSSASAGDFAGTGSGERFVILALERDGLLRPMSMNLTPREGDVAQVAIHLPEAREAVAALEALGWSVAPGASEQPG
jgi:NhaP-type Na+/H+ or K+/H+ antiporter